MLITPEYLKVCRETHEQKPSWGNDPKRKLADIFDFIRLYGIKSNKTKYPHTILDYGCGKGKLSTILNYKVVNYDPTVTRFSEDPPVCDFLLSIDVMEHVEERCVDDVLKHMNSKFRYHAFISIANGPAVQTLIDGRNAHITQKPFIWWFDKLVENFHVVRFWNQDDRPFDPLKGIYNFYLRHKKFD